MESSLKLLQDQLVALLPRLRRFARSLTHHAADADDLVQLALERALQRIDQWRAGTGGLFDLPAPEADLTIIGSSPLAKTYPSKQRLICWHLSEPVHLRTARSGLRPWLGGL